MSTKTIYLPGLNGLRAIAAISVVIDHTTQLLNKFNLDPNIFGSLQNGDPKGLSLGGYGVSIFFVLSGFLITYLLQIEKEVQPINIKKFYLRRILRIWPLYYLYLIVVLITIYVFDLYFNLNSLFLYLFYAANIPHIFGTQLPSLIHYWSLGVEEQFYLFWPWINKKFKSIFKFTLILITVLLGTKVALHFFHPNSLLESIIHITRFHCMMIGGLGAILYKREHPLFLKIIDNKLTQSICWFIIFLVAINKWHLASVIDNEIISVVSLFLIIGQIRVKNRIVNLEVNLLHFLGKISYGIYVIHPVIIFFLYKIIFPHVDLNGICKYITVYTLTLCITILFAYLSYEFFEKYFLKMKEKLSVVKSSGTKYFKDN